MPVKFLFSEGRAAGTVLLWIPFFMNLLIIYFVVNWLPSLLRQADLPSTAGITAIILFSVGGVAGSFTEGYMMNWWGALPVLLAEFVATALLIVALASFSSFALMMAITLVLGFVVEGAQGALIAVSASFYPTAIRSTGVGWAFGVGRIGSIVGPMLGGLLLTMRWGPREIIKAGAIPALCAVVAILVSMWRLNNFAPTQKENQTVEEQPV
jgi:AAHS family 4-hydroxybenzoate transporter-like MFS transporter